MIFDKAFPNNLHQATLHPVTVLLETLLAIVRRPFTERGYPVQGVFTSVVGEEGPPATLAMLRSSRFIAYAERTGRGPLPPSATSAVEPSVPFPAQPLAEQPAAALPSDADAESASGAEADGDVGPSTGPEDGRSRSPASEPQDAMSEADTSSAAHEAAPSLSAEGDDVASGGNSASVNSRGRSPAASDRMELQLPPMVRCASPLQPGQRAQDIVGQRHDMLSAGPLAGPVTLSDMVHIGSSCSADTSPHQSLRSAASPRSISQASLPPPPSPSSLDASAPPAESADIHADDLSCASAGPCETLAQDQTPCELPGSDAGGSDGVCRAAAYDPASEHSGAAVVTTAELQCVGVHAAMAASRPSSEQEQDLTTADEQLLHDLRHSEYDGGALPLGGGLQYAHEHCSPPESGAVAGHLCAGKNL